jgi:transposase
MISIGSSCGLRRAATHAECPSCGGASARVHSRCVRQVHDLAVGGRQVLIHLRVRRYFCDVADCGVRTFVTTA